MKTINSINISIHKALLSLLGIALYPLSCLFFHMEKLSGMLFPHQSHQPYLTICPTSVPVSAVQKVALDMLMSFVVTISSFMTAVVYYILGQFMIVLKINKCFHLMKSITKTEYMLSVSLETRTIYSVSYTHLRAHETRHDL